MFWGAYYVVKYILDKKVKTVSELQSTYRLQVIGRVAAGERTSKGLDKFIDKIYEGIKEQPDTLDYVVQAVNAMEGGQSSSVWKCRGSGSEECDGSADI